MKPNEENIKKLENKIWYIIKSKEEFISNNQNINSFNENDYVIFY